MLRTPGIGRAWGQIQTKQPSGLVCRFVGKKGQFNLSHFEGIGVNPQLDTETSEADTLWLTFQQFDQVQASRLKKVLTEHLGGFREAFTKARA
jgi:hypothetical protein